MKTIASHAAYWAMVQADQEFEIALAEAYGKAAREMRYSWDKSAWPAELRAKRELRNAAIERWREASREAA